MGQRAVAKATKEMFNLETFAHSTLGRAFKALEQSIASIEKKDQNKKMNTDAGKTTGNQANSNINRMPTTQDTACRRKKVAAFLKDFNKTIKPEGTNICEFIHEKARNFVRRYHDEYNRLLI